MLRLYMFPRCAIDKYQISHRWYCWHDKANWLQKNPIYFIVCSRKPIQLSYKLLKSLFYARYVYDTLFFNKSKCINAIAIRILLVILLPGIDAACDFKKILAEIDLNLWTRIFEIIIYIILQRPIVGNMKVSLESTSLRWAKFIWLISEFIFDINKKRLTWETILLPMIFHEYW